MHHLCVVLWKVLLKRGSPTSVNRWDLLWAGPRGAVTVSQGVGDAPRKAPETPLRPEGLLPRGGVLPGVDPGDKADIPQAGSEYSVRFH